MYVPIFVHRFTDDSHIYFQQVMSTPWKPMVAATVRKRSPQLWRMPSTCLGAPMPPKICPLAGGNFNKSWGTCKCWKMMINHIFGGIQFGEKTLFLFNHYVTVPCLCPWNVNDGVTIYILYYKYIYIIYHMFYFHPAIFWFSHQPSCSF